MAVTPNDNTSSKTDLVALTELLRRRRAELGLSARRLAERAGLHHAALSRIESGERRPNPETLQRLSAALELDEADLFALAGYRLPAGLPGLPAYLRAKYRMPEEATRQLTEYFGYLAEKYNIEPEGDETRLGRG